MKKIHKFNNLLYHLLWKDKGIYKKTIFIALPFLLMAVFWIIIDKSGAYHIVDSEGNDGYGFLDDYSNRYVLFGVFFFVYFARSLYTEFLQNKIDLVGKSINDKKADNINNTRNIVKIIIYFINLFLSPLALFFFYEAKSKGGNNWYSLLPKAELVYFCVLITFVWNLSLNLFFSIMTDCYTLLAYLKNPIISAKINCYASDKCCGFRKTINALSSALGFALYFLVFVSVICYSDYRAHNLFGLDMLFYKQRYIIILITIIVATLFFTIVLYAYWHLHTVLIEKISVETNKTKPLSLERKFLESINTSMFTFSDMLAFIYSAAIPIIAAIISL